MRFPDDARWRHDHVLAAILRRDARLRKAAFLDALRIDPADRDYMSARADAVNAANVLLPLAS